MFFNPYAADLSHPPAEGSFDFTLAGDVSLEPFLEEEGLEDFIAIRRQALGRFMENSAHGLFVEPNEIEGIYNMPISHRRPGYNFNRIGNTAFVSLNARDGSLTRASVYNWSFVNEVRTSGVDHVVFMMSTSPQNLIAAERQMFLEAIEGIARTGTNVFVVTADGFSNTQTIANDVTFINIGGLLDHYGNVNNDFSILRLRVTGDIIHFDIQNAF